MDDLTDEEAITAVTDGINALFAAHRDAVGPEECRAMIMVEIPREHPEWWEDCGDRQFYVFDSFCNGVIRPEGEASLPIATLRWAVDATIKAVAERFPDHASQQVIWRHPPEVSRQPALDPSDMHPGFSSWAQMHLYMRLVATPLGV